jgi:hypothetical protein
MVIKQVKHWMKLRASASLWKPVAEWSASRGGVFQLTEEGEGFLIDEPSFPPGPLRIEWGAPQRDYVMGQELRMRLELKLSPDLQVMVIERELLDVLERAVFEAYTDTLQTRMDADTPEEMRWLVMFGKAEQWTSKVARSRFSACGVTKELAAAWVDGSLGESLALATQDLVPAKHPFVMLTQRGNLYLRTRMPEVELEAIKGFLKLAESAAREARQVQSRLAEIGLWPSSTSGVFPPSSRLGEEPSQPEAS